MTYKCEQIRSPRRHGMLCAAAIFGVLSCFPLKAQTCDTVLQNLQSWLTAAPYRALSFKMASNRSDGRYVSYSEGATGTPGTLNYYPPYNIAGLQFPAYLQGEMTQYFSDRRFHTDPNPNGQFEALEWAPFNPLPVWFGKNGDPRSGSDLLRVTILLGPQPLALNPPPYGTVTLTTLSWPPPQSTSFLPSCQNGLMYGFTGSEMWVISLNELQLPPPRQ